MCKEKHHQNLSNQSINKSIGIARVVNPFTQFSLTIQYPTKLCSTKLIESTVEIKRQSNVKIKKRMSPSRYSTGKYVPCSLFHSHVFRRSIHNN